MKVNIIVVDNHGFASIGGLSKSGRQRWLRHEISLPQRHRASLDGETLAYRFRQELREPRRACHCARATVSSSRGRWPPPRRTVADRSASLRKSTAASACRVTAAWWDVPVAEVSEMPKRCKPPARTMKPNKGSRELWYQR